MIQLSPPTQPRSFKHLARFPYLPHFILISLLHIVITAFCASHLPAYSFQSRLYENARPQIAAFAQFDGFHFMLNDYRHEQDFAFLPGYTLVARCLQSLLGNIQNTIIALVLINKVLTFLALPDLVGICEGLKLSKKATETTVYLFIFSPAAVFMHSVYSEPLYILLTFKAINAQITHKNTLMFTLYLSVAMLVRSTALFVLPVAGLPLLLALWSRLTHKNYKPAVEIVKKGALILATVCLPFMGYLWWSYRRICGQGSLAVCSQSLPNVYSWVQAQYWNVGPLAYYSPNNALFITIGLPAIIISLLLIPRPHRQTMGLHLSFLLLLIVTILLTNIQSSTRFLGSHPMFYINMATALHSGRFGRVVQFWVKGWSLGMCVCGMVLFAVGFPWT